MCWLSVDNSRLPNYFPSNWSTSASFATFLYFVHTLRVAHLFDVWQFLEFPYVLRATHHVMDDGMGKKQSLEKGILKSSIVTTFVAIDSYQQHEAQESFISSSLSLLLLLCVEWRVKNSKQKLITKSLKSNNHAISLWVKGIPNIC